MSDNPGVFVLSKKSIKQKANNKGPMKKGAYLFIIILVLFATHSLCHGKLNTPTRKIKLIRQIELPGVKGRLDHMAVDPKRQVLFVAAYGNNSLEIIDLRRGKVIRAIRGLDRPQDVKYIPGEDLIAVSNGGDGTLRFFKASSLRPVKTIDFRRDADNLRLGQSAKRLYVAYGEGAIGIVGLPGLKRIGDIWLGAHPESFQIDRTLGRMYVNVPGKREIAVIDMKLGKVISRWSFTPARDNFPMALDEKKQRLFIGAWKPAVLVTYDALAGTPVSRVRISGDADDIFLDQESGLVFCSCGAGFLDIVAQRKRGYEVIERVHTAPGARTSLLIPRQHRIYVAAPAEYGREARVLEFKTE
ncbi:MAG: hypothetical protein M0Z58_00630 [Nitrospiraceae bacterium]|nr:hypothetical protein [Nitrospiraceae bacterium]